MKLNVTDQATLQTLAGLAVDGEVTISARRLAEHIGRSRATAATSLHRLTVAGHIQQTRRSRGLQSRRYRVVSAVGSVQDRDKSLTTIEAPGRRSSVVPDLFRSQDLYGAGRLWDAAPKGQPFSVTEIIGWNVTRSPASVRSQLMKLESLRVPLATGQIDPTHAQRQLWTFLEMTPESERQNFDHLDAIGGRARPRTRIESEMQHLLEQEKHREWRGMEPYSVVVDRDIIPRVVVDPESECWIYLGKLNDSGYGTVYANYWGIGAHRMTWVAERGPVPADRELHHLCLQRNCVNVEHLIAVSRAEHIRIHQALATPVDSC